MRKIQFPRLVIPLSVVLLSLFNLALNLIVVLIFASIEGVRPMLSWLELPSDRRAAGVLRRRARRCCSRRCSSTSGTSQPIWEVVTQILFYASPVIIPIDRDRVRAKPALVIHVYMASPLAVMLQQFRHAMVNHHATQAADGRSAVSQALLVIPIGIVVGVFVLGFWVFNRIAPHVAENL